MKTLIGYSVRIALGFCLLLNVFAANAGIGRLPSAVLTSFSPFSTPQNLGSNINSADMEQFPAPSPNGLSLYFTSNRTTGSQGGNDIWVSQRAITGGAWGSPLNLGPTLNTANNDSVTNISADGLKMFITSNRAGNPDLYISTRTDPTNDFSWSTPGSLGPILNSSAQDVGGVYFTEPTTGGGTLFFWSDRAETGLGNIYQASDNLDGTFNPPVLVSELNSPASERGIAISRDGLEMFISSNRLGPASEFSIFASTRVSIDATWNPPVPVAGLNAASTSQPALSDDGSVLYVSSNRLGTIGLGDIYSAFRLNVHRTPGADFDGDGRSDLSVFRPSSGIWYVMESGTNTVRLTRFGSSGDKVVAGDYDGDGRVDHAVFRPATGEWWIQKSSNGAVSVTTWGLAADKLVPSDYDGDGRTDIAVFRDGAWYIHGQLPLKQFGLSSDIPVPYGNGP